MSNIFVALDFTNLVAAKTFVEKIDPSTCNVKVGKALFTLAGPSFIEYLHRKNFKVFLDLKFHDIPNTVMNACEVCASLNVDMLTVHCLGGLDMLQAAKAGVEQIKNSTTKILGVTVLTSMSQTTLSQIGISNTLTEQVLLLADLAAQSELHGIVCSAQEVVLVKNKFAQNLKLLTPGIRLSYASNEMHDQNRVMTPNEAVAAGSDYLVIGRPITQAKDPQIVLDKILQDLNQ